MIYKVIHFFTDLQDNNYPYSVGDRYPRNGLDVSEARIRELSGKDNKQGKPLIVAELEIKVTHGPYTKSEINRMSTAELKALATEKGVDGANDMTGVELKKILIEMLVV